MTSESTAKAAAERRASFSYVWAIFWLIFGMSLGSAVIVGSILYVNDIKYVMPLPTVAQRLAFAARCLVASAGVVFFFQVRVMMARFLSPAMDPSTGEYPLVTFRQRVLQNTLEQFLTHVIAVFSLATVLDENTLKFVPLLVAIWVAGRLFFVLGWSITPALRGFGFFLTFGSSGGALGYVAYQLHLRGIFYGLVEKAGNN